MCNVLVVDDHPALLDDVVRALTRRGHVVTTATTAEEAIARLDGVCAAVVDFDLFDAPGSAVLADIRREGRPIRVALWTASAFWSGLWGYGPDAVFRKPADLQKLVAWVDTG